MLVSIMIAPPRLACGYRTFCSVGVRLRRHGLTAVSTYHCDIQAVGRPLERGKQAFKSLAPTS